ncbi:MAG: non-canonical purine NTP pyrophosphatase [Chlorobiaceae bacterium]|nr:non-canonical purine NTP pyrophosphatase [Chlorobiaceae bacterium]
MQAQGGDAGAVNHTVAIVLATGNRDKVREIRPMLEGLSPMLRVWSLADLGLSADIEETEPTLEGNAGLKAAEVLRLVAPRLGWFIALADDTGLEVDALGGAPGVRSARFAPVPEGTSPSYAQNVEHLLRSMAGFDDRTARFRTVMAMKGRLPLPGGGLMPIDETVDGRIEGRITSERHGEGGFGYDPVFMPEGSSRTFAEMRIEEKNAISHRGRAVSAAAARIRELMARCSFEPTPNAIRP